MGKKLTDIEKRVDAVVQEVAKAIIQANLQEDKGCVELEHYHCAGARWSAGDARVFAQQEGTATLDNESPIPMIFIVSFLGCPDWLLERKYTSISEMAADVGTLKTEAIKAVAEHIKEKAQCS